MHYRRITGTTAAAYGWCDISMSSPSKTGAVILLMGWLWLSAASPFIHTCTVKPGAAHTAVYAPKAECASCAWYAALQSPASQAAPPVLQAELAGTAYLPPVATQQPPILQAAASRAPPLLPENLAPTQATPVLRHDALSHRVRPVPMHPARGGLAGAREP
ncbi:MAG: hypothetical protein ACP5VE_07915 [Chthonomonadales bacterium]